MKYSILILTSLFLLSFTADTDTQLFLKVNKSKGYYYFANAKGKMALKEKYTSASHFSEGYAVATTDEKYGVIDKDGKWIIEEKFYDIGDFHDGMAWFKYGKYTKYGYFNAKGEKAISTDYDFASDFDNGYAIVGYPNDERLRLGKGKFKFDIINTKEEKLFDSSFSAITVKNDTTYLCTVDKLIYKMSRSGQVLSVDTVKKVEKKEVVDSTIVNEDKQPGFPGGDDARIGFIVKNVYYPSNAKQRKEEGTVYVRFVVEKDGQLSNIKVLRSPHPSLSKEAVRVLRESPNWIPGEQRGKKVRATFLMPFRFTLGS